MCIYSLGMWHVLMCTHMGLYVHLCSFVLVCCAYVCHVFIIRVSVLMCVHTCGQGMVQVLCVCVSMYVP